jgi:MgtC family
MALHLDLFLRIVAGMLLSGLIGYERDIHGRPAGLRTHAIVGMAAATFMVVSTQFVYLHHYGRDDPVTVDTSRIAASVVTGVGFLGVEQPLGRAGVAGTGQGGAGGGMPTRVPIPSTREGSPTHSPSSVSSDWAPPSST